MFIGKCYWKSEYKFFLNSHVSNTTTIALDIFINPTEDTQKITLGSKKVLPLQKPVQILKKTPRILILDNTCEGL